MDSTLEAEIETIEGEWAEYIGLPLWVSSDSDAVNRRMGRFKLTERQRNWFVGARDELGDKFYQEYPHTPDSAFAAVHDGAYYARLWRSRGTVWDEVERGKSLYDEALEVHTAWDLGRADIMVIVFFQVHGSELRVIDEYHNHGEALEHYVNVLWEKRAENDWVYGRHVLPHDAKVTDLSSDISRKHVLNKLGLRGIKVLKRTKDVNNDIEQVRQAIPHMYIDKVDGSYIVKMMGRYTKQWDDLLGTFKDKPLHNEWSNSADAIRYMVMARMHESSSVFENSNGEGLVDKVKGRGRGARTNVVDGMAL